MRQFELTTARRRTSQRALQPRNRPKCHKVKLTKKMIAPTTAHPRLTIKVVPDPQHHGTRSTTVQVRHSHVASLKSSKSARNYRIRLRQRCTGLDRKAKLASDALLAKSCHVENQQQLILDHAHTSAPEQNLTTGSSQRKPAYVTNTTNLAKRRKLSEAEHRISSRAPDTLTFMSNLPSGALTESPENQGSAPAAPRGSDALPSQHAYLSLTAGSNAGRSGSNRGSNRGSEAPGSSTRTARSSQTRAERSSARNGRILRGQDQGQEDDDGGGGDEDEPPEIPSQIPVASDEPTTLRHIRQRQAELKRVFAVIASQQKEGLATIASRDVAKLISKTKAHTKATEYTELTTQLHKIELETEAVIRDQYKCDIALANELHKANEEIINKQFEQRCRDARLEHIRGAQGELILLYEAHRRAGTETTKETTTSPDSPKTPDTNTITETSYIRGYASTRVLDDKAFKTDLAAEGEEAEEDFIHELVVAPLSKHVEALDAAKKKTLNGQREISKGLTSVAAAELEDVDVALYTGPIRPKTWAKAWSNPQFALSRLADCAHFLARRKWLEEQEQMDRLAANEALPLGPSQRLCEHGAAQSAAPTSTPIQPPPPVDLSRSNTQDTNGDTHIGQGAVRRDSRISISRKPRPFSSSKDDEIRSQSSSNTSTPLATLAPAPARLSQTSLPNRAILQDAPVEHMPPPSTQPLRSPIYAHPYHPPVLAPITTAFGQQIPHLPMIAPTNTGRNAFPPHFHDRRMSAPNGAVSPYSFPAGYPPLHSPPQPPIPAPAYSPTTTVAPAPDQPQAQSPIERQPMSAAARSRMSISAISATAPVRGRIGGPRREPGQITFTPAQTPDSDRFKTPAAPTHASYLPGQAVLRPGTAPNSNTDANSRAQQAADAAKVNAGLNAVHGAGPKGGRRLLLPKGR